MKRKWFFFLAPFGVALFIAICGEVVMHLWNWLLPSLFGWREITFWQALGLLVLCRILFGGFGGHGHDRSKQRGPWGGKRWERMTPEEREKLRQNLRNARCGGFGEPESKTAEPA